VPIVEPYDTEDKRDIRAWRAGVHSIPAVPGLDPSNLAKPSGFTPADLSSEISDGHLHARSA